MKSATLAIALGLSAVLVGSQIFSGEKQIFLQCDLPEQAQQPTLGPQLFVAYHNGGNKALVTNSLDPETAGISIWADMLDEDSGVVLNWQDKHVSASSDVQAPVSFVAEIAPVSQAFHLRTQTPGGGDEIEINGFCKPLIEHAALEKQLAQS